VEPTPSSSSSSSSSPPPPGRGRGGEDGRIAGGVESEKNAENDDGGVIRSCWSGG